MSTLRILHVVTLVSLLAGCTAGDGNYWRDYGPAQCQRIVMFFSSPLFDQAYQQLTFGALVDPWNCVLDVPIRICGRSPIGGELGPIECEDITVNNRDYQYIEIDPTWSMITACMDPDEIWPDFSRVDNGYAGWLGSPHGCRMSCEEADAVLAGTMDLPAWCIVESN